MPRNGSGTYTIPTTLVAGTTALASDMNDNFSDLATALTGSLATNGESTMTGQIKAANGTEALPSITFGSDPNTGLRRKGADNIGISCGGTEVGDVATTGWTLPTLTVSTTITVPNTSFTYAKLQNVSATDMLLGRSTAGAGAIEEIACTAAGRALLDDAAASNQRTTLGLGTSAVIDTGTSGTKVALLDGNNTHSGTNTFSGTAGVTARNTVKAYANFSASGGTVVYDSATQGFNVATIVRTGTGVFTVTFTTNLPTANYGVEGNGWNATNNPLGPVISGKAVSGFTLTTRTGAPASNDPDEFTFHVFNY